MTGFEVVVLGMVQGITEFIPISSTGHLVLARMVFGLSSEASNSFDAFLHLGTLLAVLVYYKRLWWGMARAFWSRDEEALEKRQLAAKIALASMPAVVVGWVGQNYFEQAGRSLPALAWSLLFTAGVLVMAEIIAYHRSTRDTVRYSDAWYMGLAQTLALIPAVSRSAVTIAVGRLRGLSRAKAASFSFLMSAPVIAGAGLASLPRLIGGFHVPLIYLCGGFVVSFVAGLASIALIMKVIERWSFLPFAVYLIILAGVLLYAA